MTWSDSDPARAWIGERPVVRYRSALEAIQKELTLPDDALNWPSDKLLALIDLTVQVCKDTLASPDSAGETPTESVQTTWCGRTKRHPAHKFLRGRTAYNCPGVVESNGNPTPGADDDQFLNRISSPSVPVQADEKAFDATFTDRQTGNQRVRVPIESESTSFVHREENQSFTTNADAAAFLNRIASPEGHEQIQREEAAYQAGWREAHEYERGAGSGLPSAAIRGQGEPGRESSDQPLPGEPRPGWCGRSQPHPPHRYVRMRKAWDCPGTASDDAGEDSWRTNLCEPLRRELVEAFGIIRWLSQSPDNPPGSWAYVAANDWLGRNQAHNDLEQGSSPKGTAPAHSVERFPERCHHCKVCEAPPFHEDGHRLHLYERGQTVLCEVQPWTPDKAETER